jgi:hypothetical protein
MKSMQVTETRPMINATAHHPPLGGSSLTTSLANLTVYQAPALDSLKHIWDRSFGLWQANQKLITYASALLALCSFAYVLVIALLSVLAWVPFAASLLKLIGFGFALRFGARHLLFAVNRQDVGSQAQQLKAMILG